MRNKLLIALGTVLIIAPEPITTVIGAFLLFKVVSQRKRCGKRGSFCNSSGVIVRSGSLPSLRARAA